MNKIYEQTNDLHVRNIIFYGNLEDKKLYVDKEHTKQATWAQAEDAFVKGQLLITIQGESSEVFFIPVVLGDGSVSIFDGNDAHSLNIAVPEAE